MEPFIDRLGIPHELPKGRTAEPRRSVYAAIIEAGQILVIVPREGRGLELPGGAVERGESDAEALTREVREETGYGVAPETKPFALMQSRFYATDIDTYFISTMLFYRASVIKRDGNGPEDTEEVEQAAWRSFDDPLLEELQHLHRRALRTLQA